AGFMVRDIILKIDGQKINGRQSVMDMVTDLRPGSVIEFTLLRKGQEMIVPVTIAEDSREEAHCLIDSPTAKTDKKTEPLGSVFSMR
ncbi:S1C family serine protease, partial [Guyparkeria sp. 1SP6A2]|nr:S1C family serine protease [Guyparkeria sp. 1SP6A2]